jgi:hypothetical protein
VYPSRRPTSTLRATFATLCKHCVSAGPSQSCRLTLSAAAMSAPFSSSKATTSKCPSSAATLTAVLPCCSSRLGGKVHASQATRSVSVAAQGSVEEWMHVLGGSTTRGWDIPTAQIMTGCDLGHCITLQLAAWMGAYACTLTCRRVTSECRGGPPPHVHACAPSSDWWMGWQGSGCILK